MHGLHWDCYYSLKYRMLVLDFHHYELLSNNMSIVGIHQTKIWFSFHNEWNSIEQNLVGIYFTYIEVNAKLDNFKRNNF